MYEQSVCECVLEQAKVQFDYLVVCYRDFGASVFAVCKVAPSARPGVCEQGVCVCECDYQRCQLLAVFEGGKIA